MPVAVVFLPTAIAPALTLALALLPTATVSSAAALALKPIAIDCAPAAVLLSPPANDDTPEAILPTPTAVARSAVVRAYLPIAAESFAVACEL